MKQVFIPVLCLMLLVLSCSSPATKEETSYAMVVNVANPLDIALTDAVISIQVDSIIKQLTQDSIAIFEDAVLPVQKNDLDNDSQIDEILVLCSFEPNETKELTVRKIKAGEEIPAQIKRTQADLWIKENGEWKETTKEDGTSLHVYEGGTFKEVNKLRVPDQQTDLSFYIKYEGIGWESDKVGYRFYLDWRNAIDIFGKKIPDMVLQNVGQKSFESYHHLTDWGMDVLKVGSSLGIGSIGCWADNKANRVAETDSVICEITINGDLQSKIETNYYGWNVAGKTTDLASRISINAGSRLTKYELVLSKALDNICTGIVKNENGKLIKSRTNNSDWSYIATFGQQSLANDTLGMAVFFKTNELIESTEDEHSHVVVLKPGNKQLTYYFAATWQQESDALKTETDFIDYLDNKIKELDNPIEIK